MMKSSQFNSWSILTVIANHTKIWGCAFHIEIEMLLEYEEDVYTFNLLKELAQAAGGAQFCPALAYVTANMGILPNLHT